MVRDWFHVAVRDLSCWPYLRRPVWVLMGPGDTWRSVADDGGYPINLIASLGQDELSAMDRDEALPVSVVALRAEGYTTETDSIVISLRTKFSSAERRYSVPVECFRDFIVDLQRLSTGNSAEPSVVGKTHIAAE
jgi:hypothetical protein